MNAQMDPHDRGEYLSRRHPEDARPANITTYQAMRCSAIISAAQDGHELWRERLDDVSKFLAAAGIEGGGAGICPSAADHWATINKYGWPPQGKSVQR